MPTTSNTHAKVIGAVEDFHFWHVPRRSLFIELIQQYSLSGSRTLDIGCGTGKLCRELVQRGYAPIGMDLRPPAVDESTGLQVAGEATRLPWAPDSFDVICLLDVLEHIDDQACLTEVLRVLKPGGVLLASAPAYECLWGKRDVEAGHLRRYSKRDFRRILTSSGFSLERLFGYQFFLLPVVALTRWYQRSSKNRNHLRREDRPSSIVNAVFRAINTAEVVIGRVLRPPFGSSLIAVARKPCP